MGLLDFLMRLFGGGDTIECPNCGTPGARKTDDEVVHCKNPRCPYFDASLGRAGTLRQAGTTVPTRGNFSPEHPVSIRYVNFAGQSRDFSAERDSLVRKKNHIVAEVAPTGRKIVLSRDRIQNLSEVEGYMPKRVEPGQAWPTRVERQILGYHKNHGTTSPRYEQLRAKYPNW
jgi:hypothetical protein